MAMTILFSPGSGLPRIPVHAALFPLRTEGRPAEAHLLFPASGLGRLIPKIDLLDECVNCFMGVDEVGARSEHCLYRASIIGPEILEGFTYFGAFSSDKRAAVLNEQIDLDIIEK
jgi:hypothetical protein